ncbi:MAG: S8 family serine peptidase [Pseudomonadota bacterium]
MRDDRFRRAFYLRLPDIIALLDFHDVPGTPDYDGDPVREELDALLDMQADPEREERRAEIESERGEIVQPFLDIFEDAGGAPASLVRLLTQLENAGTALASVYKERFERPRPHIVDHAINPMITVPNHGAYPSGHATQSALLAHGMAEVFGHDPGVVAEAFDVAQRIRENREWAGVHYASDGTSGAAIAAAAFTDLREVFDELFVDAIADVQAYDPGPSPYLGNGPTGSRVPVPPASVPMDQWSLERLGIGAGGVAPETGGAGVLVGLVDAPVDVTHPVFERGSDHAIDKALAETTDPATWSNATVIHNADYTEFSDGRLAFSSKGNGHGTAMAGLIAGTPAPGIEGFYGTAPQAKLSLARVTTRLADGDENRLDVAKVLLDMAFGPAPADVILVGPPFVRPDPAIYPTAWDQGLDNSDFAQTPCDPLAMAILLASLYVPVVIPSGNDGTSMISYPGAPEDFAGVRSALGDAAGLHWVREMVAREGLRVTEDMLEKASEMGDASTGDPFADTGIIVVGSAKLSNPANRLSPLEPAGYSQHGPGLCFLCPSDRDEDPSAPRDPASKSKFNYVPAPDILGHGGYAEEPSSLVSHQGGEFGFGGTSAASAQATGVIARLIEARRSAGQGVTGPEIRSAIAGALGGPYETDKGYGILTVQALL